MERKVDNYTIRLRRNFDYTKVFSLRQTVNGQRQPVDITGWIFTFTIQPDDADELIFDVDNGKLTIDVENATVTLSIRKEDIATYEWSKGNWSLSYEFAGTEEPIHSDLIEVLGQYD